jgi:hypothetical protein
MQNLTVDGKTFHIPTETAHNLLPSNGWSGLQVEYMADTIRALEEEKRNLQGLVCFLLRKNEELRNRINS